MTACTKCGSPYGPVCSDCRKEARKQEKCPTCASLGWRSSTQPGASWRDLGVEVQSFRCSQGHVWVKKFDA